MKNAIELAKVTKEVYRATNDLLQIIVTLKTRSKKMKEYKTIGKDISQHRDELENATSRVVSAVKSFMDWAQTASISEE